MTAHEGLPEPTRYDWQINGVGVFATHRMMKRKDGEFVTYEDYTAMLSALEARCGELEGAAQSLGDIIEQALAEHEQIGFVGAQTIEHLQSWLPRLRALSSNSRKEGEG